MYVRIYHCVYKSSVRTICPHSLTHYCIHQSALSLSLSLSLHSLLLSSMAALAVVPPSQLRPTAPPFENIWYASLYVGDLDPAVTETDLGLVFGGVGPVHSVRVVRDWNSGESLLYGYVNFFSSFFAGEAIARLNHTYVKGKPIRVMWCEKDPLKRKTGDGNLFVKNLDHSITSSELEKIFSKYGSILSCKVAEDNGKSKGFGFVHFSSVDSSVAALNYLNGVMLRGKKLYVSKFLKKNKRKGAHEEQKFTNLYVKYLKGNVTEDLLRDKFSSFGKVRKVHIMKYADGKSRGFGFVDFESHEDAKAAMKALNGTSLGSEKLFVGKALKKAERQELYGPKEIITYYAEKSYGSKLYVKNLHFSTNDNDLLQHFCPYGKVISAKVVRDNNGLNKGSGFVHFSTPEEANMALGAHGTPLLGRPLYVAVAEPKEEHQRKLQSDYVYAPQFLPFYSFLPPFAVMNPASYISSSKSLMYPYSGNVEVVMYPFAAQIYQQKSSAYPIESPTATIPSKETMKYESHKGQKFFKKRNGHASKAPRLNNSEREIGDFLYPHVENLQPEHGSKLTGMQLEMVNSDLYKRAKSPNSSSVHVDKAVKVLWEANSQSGGDYNHIAVAPSKSARRLRY